MESSTVLVTATTLAALLVVGVVLWRQSKKQKTKKRPLEEMKVPTKWTKVGEVGELILYPLKGGKRRCVTEAECTKIGLREIDSEKLSLQDRVFVVYTDNHEFINAKKNAKILLVETNVAEKSTVRFSFPDADDLFVKMDENNNNLKIIDFWYGEKTMTVDCGDEAATWFSQRLINKTDGLRLGCFIQSLVPPRSLEGSSSTDLPRVYPKYHPEYMGAYADIASYMLMGEESMKDLNSRLNKPVTEHNFRPNIMVKGSPPYSEDTWDWVKVGENIIFRSFKYCTRCVVTTVDPDTTEKDPSVEPLRTLRTYRQVKEPTLRAFEGNAPVMGLYLGCHQTGEITVGDPVYINTTETS